MLLDGGWRGDLDRRVIDSDAQPGGLCCHSLPREARWRRTLLDACPAAVAPDA
jgi:hypothetical protein